MTQDEFNVIQYTIYASVRRQRMTQDEFNVIRYTSLKSVSISGCAPRRSTPCDNRRGMFLVYCFYFVFTQDAKLTTSIFMAVLDGELAVPCTCNPL